MNILILTTDMERKTGYGTVAYYLNKYLTEKKHNVTVFMKPKVYSISILERLTQHNYFRELYNKQFDLIVCVVESFLPAAVKLKDKCKAKQLVLTAHGTYVDVVHKNPELAAEIDYVIVPSRYTYNQLRFGRKFIINWGVDTEIYKPTLVKKEKNSMIFVGTPKGRKGILYLILALKIIKSKIPDVKLYIVSKKNDDVLKMAFENEVQENIEFTGNIDNEKLMELYNKVMLNVLPSVNARKHFEGLGLVHYEANACGTPTIGSYECGNEDAIKHGVTGYLCPQRDYNKLAELIMKIFKMDKSEYEKMQRQCLEHALNNTWEKSVAKVNKLLRENR